MPELGMRDATEASGGGVGFHPILLKAIKRSAEAAAKKDIPNCCCGALASSLRYIPLLIGAGVNSLSVSRGQLKLVAKLLESITYEEAKKLVAEALTAGTEQEVELLLNRRYRTLITGDWSGLDLLKPQMIRGRLISDILSAT
jgi:phosphoenolpyruvate-protein kinase (PTS system EI component)